MRKNPSSRLSPYCGSTIPDPFDLIDGKIANDQQVKNAASEEAKKNPDIQAIISADKDVTHGRVVSVLDLVKAAGVKKFAISIDKK